ncbi:MAG: hypothetical protein Q8R79_00580 [Legionellaceae bacterium]|nr:hypothetical protein [Legionellaceae bacterium]
MPEQVKPERQSAPSRGFAYYWDELQQIVSVLIMMAAVLSMNLLRLFFTSRFTRSPSESKALSATPNAAQALVSVRKIVNSLTITFFFNILGNIRGAMASGPTPPPPSTSTRKISRTISEEASQTYSTLISPSQLASTTNALSKSNTIPLIAPFTDLTFMPQTATFSLVTNEAKFRVVSQAQSLTLKLRLPLGIGQFMTQRPGLSTVFFNWDVDRSTLTMLGSPANINDVLRVLADSIYDPKNYNSPILLAASEGGNWILAQGNTNQLELNQPPGLTGVQYPNITVTPNQKATQKLDAIPKRFNDTDGDDYTYYMSAADGSPLSAYPWGALRDNQWSGTYGAYGSFYWLVYVVDSGGLRSPSLMFCSNFEYIKPYLKNPLTNKNYATGVTFSDPISLDTFGGNIASWSASVNNQTLPATFAELMFTSTPPAVNGKIDQDSVVNVSIMVLSQYGDTAETSYLLTFTTPSSIWDTIWTVGSNIVYYGLPALTAWALRYEIPNALFYKNTNIPVEKFFNAYGEHPNLGCFHSLFPKLFAKSELDLDLELELGSNSENSGCLASLLAYFDARYPNTIVYPHLFHTPHSKDLGILDAAIAKLLSWIPLLPMRVYERFALQKLPELMEGGGFIYDVNTNSVKCSPEKIVLLGDIQEVLLLISTLNGLILARTTINLSDMKKRKFLVREPNLTDPLLNVTAFSTELHEQPEEREPASRNDYTAIEMHNIAPPNIVDAATLSEEPPVADGVNKLINKTSRESCLDKEATIPDPLDTAASQKLVESPLSAPHSVFFPSIEDASKTKSRHPDLEAAYEDHSLL